MIIVMKSAHKNYPDMSVICKGPTFKICPGLHEFRECVMHNHHICYWWEILTTAILIGSHLLLMIQVLLSLLRSF